MVASADIVADRSHQFAETAEGSSPDTLVGDFSEEAFHQIQPGSTGGREVPVIAGVCRKPSLHGKVGVGAIVVENQMDRQSAGCGALDRSRKRRNS
jgi:hypothetical protein